MTDTDKILQALARLEAGQQALQGTVNQQGKAITGLQEGQQIMQQDIKSLQEGQKTLQTDVKGLQTDVKGLQTDVKSLKEGQDTLELKVEAIGAFQQKSHAQSQRDHQEIMGHLLKNADIHDQDHTALEKRVERTEKHLNLPPVK